MADADVDYSKIDDHPKHAIRLFKVMMRIEFALKDLGFCRQRGNAVEVAWDEYAAKNISRDFFERVISSGRANVLIADPPKRQTIDPGGSLSWERVGAVSTVQDLLGAVRRVRNNLFHGGKSGDPDGDRNEELICGATYVLDEILRNDDILMTAFSGKY